MNTNIRSTIAEELETARVSRISVEPITARYPELTVEDAYAIQQLQTERRLAAGGKLLGKKVGLTSKPVQEMFGVRQPDFGSLFTDMAAANRGVISLDTLIEPKIEGEIAFVLKRDLRGPGLTAADVLRATEGVMACFEVVDSRIQNWKIGIVDTISDNASSAMFVLGTSLASLDGLDLELCGMALERNGEVVVTGAGAAALGSPVNAVAWLANKLGEFGVPLLAGEVILSGALGAMVPVARGDRFRVAIGGIGSCSVAFD